jgi:hypothetical protein
MVPRESRGRDRLCLLKHPRVLLSASLLVLGAGCIPRVPVAGGAVKACSGDCVTASPYAYFVTAHPTSAVYDWRCHETNGVAPDPRVFDFWTNDAGLHGLHVITPAVAAVSPPAPVQCVWITPQQLCAGAPAAQYAACLVGANP